MVVLLAPQSPLWLGMPCRSGCPSVLPAGPGLALGGCTLAHCWFVKKAWEALRSQQLLLSPVMTALWIKTYLAGRMSKLADSEEDCDSWTVSLILDPDCFF